MLADNSAGASAVAVAVVGNAGVVVGHVAQTQLKARWEVQEKQLDLVL